MYMASVANKFYSLVLEHRGVNSKTQRFRGSRQVTVRLLFFLVSLLFIVIIFTLFCLKLETNEPFFKILSWLSTSKGMTSLVT